MLCWGLSFWLVVLLVWLFFFMLDFWILGDKCVEWIFFEVCFVDGLFIVLVLEDFVIVVLFLLLFVVLMFDFCLMVCLICLFFSMFVFLLCLMLFIRVLEMLFFEVLFVVFNFLFLEFLLYFLLVLFLVFIGFCLLFFWILGFCMIFMMLRLFWFWSFCSLVFWVVFLSLKYEGLVICRSCRVMLFCLFLVLVFINFIFLFEFLCCLWKFL